METELWNALLLVAIGGLAGGQITRTWRTGSIFEEKRAEVEVLAAEGSLIARMLDCGMCASHWACLFCVSLLSLPTLHCTDSIVANIVVLGWNVITILSKAVVFAFAATRIAQLTTTFEAT